MEHYTSAEDALFVSDLDRMAVVTTLIKLHAVRLDMPTDFVLGMVTEALAQEEVQ